MAMRISIALRIIEILSKLLPSRWEPDDEEERRFIEKRENLEWDFESTEVDIQLSVVKRNVINLIDNMQGFVSPKLVSELVRWAMKVDDYRRTYRELLEECNRSALDSGQLIMSLGCTSEDITRAHLNVEMPAPQLLLNELPPIVNLPSPS